jgi:hypothetical protein
MDHFNALLSHQGALKHVNHAHRQCAPTPTGRITTDKDGNVTNWGLGDPPDGWTAPQLSDDHLRVNIALINKQIKQITAMRRAGRNIQPYTNYVAEEMQKMDNQLNALKAKLEEFQAMRDK